MKICVRYDLDKLRVNCCYCCCAYCSIQPRHLYLVSYTPYITAPRRERPRPCRTSIIWNNRKWYPSRELATASRSYVECVHPGPLADLSHLIIRIEKVLRKSQSADNVRPLDPQCPASSIARATRLSNLYGVSLTTKLARKGAGERPSRRRHQQLR